MEDMEEDKTYVSKEQKLKQLQKSYSYCRKHHKGTFEREVVQNFPRLKDDLDNKNVKGNCKTTKIYNIVKKEQPVIREAVRNLPLTSNTSSPFRSNQWILDITRATLMIKNLTTL